ncbi:MAG: EscU/YscU/HrcU family type III secretion system export apparatus switch protein, partial [Planctomycetota bacterium]
LGTGRKTWPTARWLVLPMLASVFVAAVIYQWFQSGFQVKPGRVTFDPSRLSWARGASKLASGGKVTKVGFGLLKIAVLVCIIGSDLWANADKVLMAPSLSTISMTGLLGQLLLVCGFKVAGVLIALGLLEYAYQWWQFERSLMMTDEEMREDLKSESANPQLLGRRNQLRQDLRT